MRLKLNVLVQIIAILSLVLQISSKFEFSNIKCQPLDEDFCSVEYCYLKSVNRSYKYFSLRVNLHKIPISKIKVNISLFKRFSGYKPFLYNVTVDYCQFIKNPKSNPIFNYFYSFLIDHSNMNHSCPYDHDVIVEKLTTDFTNRQLTHVLPFPEGEYMLETNWLAYDVNRAVVKIYGTLS